MPFDIYKRDEVAEEYLKRALADADLNGISVLAYDEVDSTNTRAKLFAQTGERKPTVFLSRQQTAGRGTRGREFESPFGAGVYISFLLFPDRSVHDMLRITSYCAVCVCRAVEKLTDGKLSPKIKWVNDVTVNDRKLAGILTEGRVSSGTKLDFCVAGIGINLTDGTHSDEVAKIMTSLSSCAFSVSYEEAAAAIAVEFIRNMPHIFAERTASEYKERSSLIGRRVKISNFNFSSEETVIDIDSDCALYTRTDDGEVNKYISADVKPI